MVVTYSLDVPLARDPVIVVTIFGFLATLTTVLRCYAMRLRGIKIGASEYLIFGALFIVYVDIAIQYILSILGGTGRHSKEVEPESVVITLKTILPLEALYGIVMSLVKSSIMLFFARIFGTKKSFKISVAVVMTIVWMWAISVILETFLLCRPLAFNWDPTLPGGSCGNRNATYVIAGTLNLLTDLMVMSLPIPHIWKLKLNVAKKVVLCMVFSMGLLVSAISIVRLTSLVAIDFDDITYSVQMGVLWTVLEPELAIICANMPVLKPILSRILPKFFPSSTPKQSYYVSDSQRFERLDERAIYPLGEFARDRKMEITGGGSSQPKDPYSLTQRSSGEESANSDNILADHASPPGGINVHKNFDVHYGP